MRARVVRSSWWRSRVPPNAKSSARRGSRIYCYSRRSCADKQHYVNYALHLMNHRRRPGTPSPLDPATCPLTCAAKNTGLNTAVQVKHGAAQASPSLTQDQRLAWLNELLTGTSESFPDRVAGVLLLLYAQPLVCVTALETDAFSEHGDELHVELGRHPVTVPQHSPASSATTSPTGRTSAPEAAATARGSSPAPAPANTSIPTR